MKHLGKKSILSVLVLFLCVSITPGTLQAQSSSTMNAWEVATCAAAGPVICGLAYTSSTAAIDDTRNRFSQSRRGDGQRGNAFQHSSWNARMAVLIGRSWAQSFSTAHEQPLTSSNPAGTNRSNRHERMDLCNNRRGWNRPSNWEILTLNQMSAVNKLYTEARDMSEGTTSLNVLLSNRSCDGTRLVYVVRNNGTWFP